jgi:hypothetical protein
MTRNLKALTLVAFLAMGAVMASTASAQKITSTGPVGLKGTLTGGVGSNAWKMFGSTFECTTVTYEGHKAFSTPEVGTKALILSGDSKFTVDQKTSGCKDGLGRPITVNMTNCDYTYTLLTPTEITRYGVETHLECKNAGEEPHIEIFNDAAHKERICTLTFPPQTRKGVHLINTSGGHLGLVGTFNGFVIKREGLCLLDGKGTNTASAELALDVTISGTNAAGEPTAISVS